MVLGFLRLWFRLVVGFVMVSSSSCLTPLLVVAEAALRHLNLIHLLSLSSRHRHRPESFLRSNLLEFQM